jgi:hypothetical protein
MAGFVHMHRNTVQCHGIQEPAAGSHLLNHPADWVVSGRERFRRYWAGIAS